MLKSFRVTSFIIIKKIYAKLILNYIRAKYLKKIKKCLYYSLKFRSNNIKKIKRIKGLKKEGSNWDAFDSRITIQDFTNIILPNILGLTSNNNLLEIGCRNSRISNINALHFNKVISIDPFYDFDKKLLKSKIKFYKKSFEDFKTSIKFDAIIFWDSFFLTKPYYNTLRKAKSLLTNDGIIVIIYIKKSDIDRINNPKSPCYSVTQLSNDTGFKELKTFLIKDFLRVFILKNDLMILKGNHIIDLKLLSKNPIIVDAGACIGAVIENLKEYNLNMQIYAIEPCAINYKYLKKNILILKFINVP